MMDNDVNQRRVAVFHIIYVYSLDLYSRWVPRPLRWCFELLILLAALLTLCVWGYVHYTYIIHPTDCLGQITQRPFPTDVVLQVEVYSNHSYLWEKRNSALHDYIAMRQKEEELRQSVNFTEGIGDPGSTEVLLEGKPWANYCNYSLLELLKVQPVCEAMVERIGEGLRELKEELMEQVGVEVENNETMKPTESARESLLGFGEEETLRESAAEVSDGVIDVMGVNDSEVVGEGVEGVGKVTEGGTVNEGGEEVGVVNEKAVNNEMERLATLVAENKTLYELLDFYTLKLLAIDYSLLEFTQETGYLSLNPVVRARLNISVVKIYVNPDETDCFGGMFGNTLTKYFLGYDIMSTHLSLLDPDETDCFGGMFGNTLTKYFLGYDIMVISSFKNLLPEKVGTGYVKDLLTGSQYYYKVQWMGKWRYLAGLLPAMFFTLVASVLLRQIHYHVFKFLTHFRNLLNQGIPMPVQTGAQIPFLIVTYAAIGLIIVMSEALSDDSMFSVLMVATVWEVDQFYAIYCRQQTSKMYFPWFFFLYHFLPYAYFVRFNGQFWFLPFLFHWLMTQHAMLFFINHCELPGNRVRIMFRLPHAHAHIPPLPGFQPMPHPQQQVFRVNVQIGAGQQPNVQVQQVNLQQPNVPAGNFQQAGAEARQENVLVVNGQGRPPSNRVVNQTEESMLRRRAVASQQRGGVTAEGVALAEEVDPRGTSEMVSVNSGFLFGRRQGGGITYGGGGTGAGVDGGLLSREGIRAARLNRFERTSVEGTVVDADRQA